MVVVPGVVVVLPGFVQITVYIVVEDGETETLPDVAPPVEKSELVHDAAFWDDQVSKTEEPCVTDCGVAVSVADNTVVVCACAVTPAYVAARSMHALMKMGMRRIKFLLREYERAGCGNAGR